MKYIVTAGGQGTKLWPYSRESKPKQFQSVIGEESLYTYTINLLLKAFPPEDIFISTKRRYMGIALEQAPRISPKNFIIEPDIAKNRGPAEGLAFLTLSMLHPNDPFMIVQPDCMRLPEDHYLQMIIDTEKLVKRDRKFISGGNKATYPALGIDYLKIGSKVDLDSRLEFFEVEEFLGRKDNLHETKELIENFYVTTHSNHNTWYPDLMLDAYRQYRPDWYEALEQIRDIMVTSNSEEKIEEIYSNMAKGPTEDVTQHIFNNGAYIILLPFKWIDIGTWNSVHEYFSEASNVYTDGNVVALDSKRSVIKNGNKDKIIAAFGVEDLIIVDTDDILLIIPRDKIEKIGDLQKALTEQDLKRYL